MIPQIASRLLQEGYTPAAVSGILGNVMKESGGNPHAVGDNGQSFGLFQHHKDRGIAMQQFAKSLGKPATDPMAQTEFAIHELKTQYPKLEAILRNETDPAAAAVAFGKMFERPNEKYADWQKRVQYAQDFHSTLQGGSGEDKLAEIQRKAALKEANLRELGFTDPKVIQGYKDGYKEGKDRKEVPQDAERLLDEQISKTIASGKMFLIPGLDEDLSTTLLSTYNDRPDDVKAGIRRAIVNADISASAKDYVNRAYMAATGTSPEVASSMVTANVPPAMALGADPTKPLADQPKPTAEGVAARLSAVKAETKAGMEQARENVPGGVGLAMDVAGALPWALAPGGKVAQTAYGAAQGMLASDDVSGSGLGKGALIGAGTALGGQALFGLGGFASRVIGNKIAGLTGGKAEREAGDIAGGLLKMQGSDIKDVERKFAERPDIPLFAQGAIGKEWQPLNMPDSEYRAATYLTRQLMGNVDPKVQGEIGQNLVKLVTGGEIRYQNMLKEVAGVEGNVRGTLYVDKLEQASRDAATTYLNKVESLTPALEKSVYQKEIVPLLKASGKLKEVYKTVRSASGFSELPKDSTRLWLEVRKQMSDINAGYTAEAGKAPYKGMYDDEVKRLSDSLKRGTTVPLDPKNPNVAKYSTVEDYYQNVKDPNDIKRAFKAGQDFKNFNDADAIRNYLAAHNSNPEQQAFMLGTIETFQKALKEKNYSVSPNFTNMEINDRIRAAFGSEEATQKFINWIAEQTSISNSIGKVAINRAGTMEKAPMSIAGRFIRDGVLTSAIFRGSMLFAGARALGETLQVLGGEATASKEGKALLAAYLTSTDPKVQKAAVANIVSRYQTEYIREAIKTYGSRVATATAIRQE